MLASADIVCQHRPGELFVNGHRGAFTSRIRTLEDSGECSQAGRAGGGERRGMAGFQFVVASVVPVFALAVLVGVAYIPLSLLLSLSRSTKSLLH